MKNVRYGLALAALCSSSMLFSQGVVDALKYSQQDIRGTARYMGMAGAFGALGGDITTLSQNPAGNRSLSQFRYSCNDRPFQSSKFGEYGWK